MRTTIDRVGRLVIPKALRDQVGLGPGEVDVAVEGTGLRIEPVSGETLERRSGRLVIPRSGSMLTDEAVGELRRGDQR
jgi:AbrB family looped-hinge helix DNA binding protein